MNSQPAYSDLPDPEDLENLENGDDEDEYEEDEDDDEEEEDSIPAPSKSRRVESDKANMEELFRRISTERVPVRVHDIIIKGNSKTKDALIESEIEAVLKEVTTFQQLLRASTVANARLRELEIFDAVTITLESGPPELPGTANVVVEITEAKNPLTGDIGVFSKPEVLFCFVYLTVNC